MPPTPSGDDEIPTPESGVPTVPEKPEDIPERRSGTPVPRFEGMGDEELEGMFDMFGYGTPLYGMFGTGFFWDDACFGGTFMAMPSSPGASVCCRPQGQQV